MKQIATEFFTFTEIGGVGEMIYRAVRFPEYVPEYDQSIKEEVIIPLFNFSQRPIATTDYSLTGQELLASLCNLYKKINAPDSSERITDLAWDWCRNNVHPYDIDGLCDEIETGDFWDINFHKRLQASASFQVKDFITDLCKLGTAFEYYDAIKKVKYGHSVAAGRNLYYEGRVCDSMPFLEKYRLCSKDEEYLQRFNEGYDALLQNALDMFPDFKMRVKQNKKTHKAEMAAEINSVFDIAWYAFARMISDVAPRLDYDLDNIFPQGSILTCMACGEYFVRHSSRQRYCDNLNCKAERNNRKARAYYQRKKSE